MIVLIKIIYIFCIYNYKGCNVYMEIELIDKFKQLSIDIIKKIIEYNGTIKWRNGVFINQINKYDLRYNLLLKIPRPFVYINSFFTFHYIIFFPRPLYSTVKRCLHIYSNSNNDIIYLLDVEDLFTVRLFTFSNSEYGFSREPIEIQRLSF